MGGPRIPGLIFCLTFFLLLADSFLSASITLPETSLTKNGTECNLCVEGQYSPEEECGLLCTDAGSCPPGFCLPCQPGSFSSKKGASECTKCEEGRYQPDEEQTDCIDCPLGTYAPEKGSRECSTCKNGTIADQEGSAICQPCRPGSTSDIFHRVCQPCSPGHHCPGPACPECLKCEPGHYQNREGQEECPTCNYGTYSNSPGMSSCIPCGAGRYLDWRGATLPTDCQLCPIGNYCPDAATASPIRCPEDAFCPQGSSQPIYCSDLFQPHPDPTVLKCEPSPMLYVVVSVSGLVLLGIIGLVIYNRRRARYDEDLREEATNILSSDNQGPVYQGL